MITLERALSEYHYRLKRLVAARAAWKNEPNLVTLLAYTVAVEQANHRQRHTDIIRTVEFPDQRKTA